MQAWDAVWAQPERAECEVSAVSQAARRGRLSRGPDLALNPSVGFLRPPTLNWPPRVFQGHASTCTPGDCSCLPALVLCDPPAPWHIFPAPEVMLASGRGSHQRGEITVCLSSLESLPHLYHQTHPPPRLLPSSPMACGSAPPLETLFPPLSRKVSLGYHEVALS